MKEINKVLIANRGEIAVRIIRSLKEMGIESVAVFSDADRQALHVREADEAFHIGAAPSVQSYLHQDKIIEVALQAKVDAIHPGYGFLSENAVFARKVEEKGIVFIGPSPETIETMGSKLAAKEAALKYKIPMVPGGNKAITDPEQAKEIAKGIGYPVLIKASAGGGGKGMRIVHEASEFTEQFNRAVSEALSAFGDGSVFLEKYISSPAHVEIQILGDSFGNIVYLFDRECSIQRRYQKVIEEAPSPKLNPEIRKKMGEAAVLVGKACNYRGAGTVEFILDENLNFYFLEMNTRLQVEHPVTELITGIDLVKEQIKIARGEKLSFTQENISFKGHAIELRIYAEDPATNFLPDTGRLTSYKIPKGPGIRIDDGFEEGMEIPVYYDPLISKLIVYGTDRKEAIARMKRAIDEYVVTGIATTLPFGKFVLNHEAFISGRFNTHFVQHFFTPDTLAIEANEATEKAIALLVGKLFSKNNEVKINTEKNRNSKWMERLK